MTGILALSVGAGLLTSCDIDGLVDVGDTLLDPKAALLDRPGRKLVSGVFGSLTVDGSLENGGSVLAIRRDTEEPTLAIVPFLEGEACELSPVVAFERLSSRVDVALPGLVSILRDRNESSRGTLSFIDFNCQDAMPGLLDAQIPRALFPTRSPVGALTITGEGELLLAQVADRNLVSIATDISIATVTQDYLWALQNGRLVAFDEQLAQVATIGDRVRSYVPTGGRSIPMVYEDATGLHVWTAKNGSQSVAPDGCGPELIGTAAVAFHDPCASRQLSVLVAAEGLSADPGDVELVKLEGQPGAILTQLVVRFGQGQEPTEILAVHSSELESAQGSLVAYQVPEKPDLGEGTLELEARTLHDNATLRNGQIYTDFAAGVGRLQELQRDDDGKIKGLVEVARNVAQLPGGDAESERGVLVDFDGVTGRLVRITREDDGSFSQELLAKRVPIQDHQIDDDQELIAFLANYDAETSTGELVLADDDNLYPVAEGVLLNTVRFLDEPFGLIYLKPANVPGEAELHVWLIDAGLDLLVHEGASEYRSIPWPSPGVLYAVPRGEDQGLWFAKAR